jgi:hypothetical protein
MNGTDAMLVGLAWYTREDYPKVLDVMQDAESLDETFDEWEESARKVEDMLRKERHAVIHVMIRPGMFLEWCTLLGLRPDAKARSKFATDKAALNPNAKDGDVIG